jgi:hypothetical protein
MRSRSVAGAAVSGPAIAGVLGAAAMAARLLLPVPVGMANNGDAVRLMCQIGANPDSPPWATSKLFFVRFWYPFLRPGSGPPCLHYPTTQVLQVWLTAWVHQHVLGLSGAIDMRELIVEYCVLAGVAMMVAARLLAELRLVARILILILLFLVLSEAVCNEVIKHMVIALFTASIAPIWLLAGALGTAPRAGPSPGSGDQVPTGKDRLRVT